jgi:hypothetical protein
MALLLLGMLCAAPSTVAAQEWDPAADISAYSAALNAHDLDSALALFDEYGSATDGSGRHFYGRAGLTEFLLGSGFGTPNASISTVALQVVANRAFWTYICSCADGSTEVRLVFNHNKISVFALQGPSAPRAQPADAGILRWLVGLGLLVGALAAGLQFGWPRGPAAPRPAQGRLLAGLRVYTATRRKARGPARGIGSTTPPGPDRGGTAAARSDGTCPSRADSGPRTYSRRSGDPHALWPRHWRPPPWAADPRAH